MSFLDQSNDPNHPRNRMSWHQVPRCLYWLCIAAAGLSAAFGGQDQHFTDIDGEPTLITYDYDFMFFRLHQSAAGKWFIKAL